VSDLSQAVCASNAAWIPAISSAAAVALESFGRRKVS